MIGKPFTSITDNECHTMKEMLKQPDRKEFEKAMGKEVQAMFDNQIWRMVPKHEMHNHYKILIKWELSTKGRKSCSFGHLNAKGVLVGL